MAGCKRSRTRRSPPRGAAEVQEGPDIENLFLDRIGDSSSHARRPAAWIAAAAAVGQKRTCWADLLPFTPKADLPSFGYPVGSGPFKGIRERRGAA